MRMLAVQLWTDRMSQPNLTWLMMNWMLSWAASTVRRVVEEEQDARSRPGCPSGTGRCRRRNTRTNACARGRSSSWRSPEAPRCRKRSSRYSQTAPGGAFGHVSAFLETMMSAPGDARRRRLSSGLGGGPERTFPARSKRPLWQGQKRVPVSPSIADGAGEMGADGREGRERPVRRVDQDGRRRPELEDLGGVGRELAGLGRDDAVLGGRGPLRGEDVADDGVEKGGDRRQEAAAEEEVEKCPSFHGLFPQGLAIL